jgi:hypothetical protein
MLRELHERAYVSMGNEAAEDILTALPELIAVVKAAEQVMGRRPETSRPIPAALTALRARLAGEA